MFLSSAKGEGMFASAVKGLVNGNSSLPGADECAGDEEAATRFVTRFIHRNGAEEGLLLINDDCEARI